jgi:hypothetical protein
MSVYFRPCKQPDTIEYSTDFERPKRDDCGVTLYPHPINRIANAAPILVLGGLAFVSAYPTWLIAPTLIAGVVLGLRGFRMSVTCTDSALVVRGMFMTRTIPRTAITSIPDNACLVPHVNWRDERGRSRWSPILVFAVGQRELPFFGRPKIAQLAKVRKWSRGR